MGGRLCPRRAPVCRLRHTRLSNAVLEDEAMHAVLDLDLGAALEALEPAACRSGHDLTRRDRAGGRHGAAVREQEGALAPVERAADHVDGDVGRHSVLQSGGRELAGRPALDVAAEGTLDVDAPEGDAVVLDGIALLVDVVDERRDGAAHYGVAIAPNTSVGLPDPVLLAWAKNTLKVLPPWSSPS